MNDDPVVAGSAAPDPLATLGFRLSLTPSAITRLDDGRIVECNETMCALTEYPREELVGKTSFDLNVWDSKAEREQFLRELEASGTVRDRMLGLRTKTGRELRVRFSARIVEHDGERCLLSTVSDAT